MIHVDPRPEPPGFDAAVRQPGLRALAEGKDELPPYWRACLSELHEAYRGVCAYLSIYIPRGTGARSVDHFVPKSKRRDLAYEWSNYRLACSAMNARKREFEDVLDPFEVQDGWFVLEMSSLQVAPSPDLDVATRARVQATIDRLQLNDDECLDAREAVFDVFMSGASIDDIAFLSPFIAKQIQRAFAR